LVRVLVMGLAFKENCPDLRNTRVIDVVNELKEYHIDVAIYDPCVDAKEARREYGVELVVAPQAGAYDAVILAVAHRQFVELGAVGIRRLCRASSVLYDVKSVLPKGAADGRL
jgi:UDP-N-acetyl-D-galactosamine dehydrogenase